MLRQRVITALIGLPCIIGALLFSPNWVAMALICSFVGLTTYELASMIVPKLEEESGHAHGRSWVIPGCVLAACFMFLGSAADSYHAGRGIILAAVLCSMLVAIFFSPSNELGVKRAFAFMAALSYGGFPWLAVWELYILGDQARYVFLLLAIVWAGDTGAYFGGKYFGGRKLAPRLSPKKTVAGAVAGLASSLLGGLAVGSLYNPPLAQGEVIALASLFGGALGQMGDLVESSFKRYSGVKDSGTIFPGHGGFMDRVDGLLFAAPIVWFVLYSFG